MADVIAIVETYQSEEPRRLALVCLWLPVEDDRGRGWRGGARAWTARGARRRAEEDRCHRRDLQRDYNVLRESEGALTVTYIVTSTVPRQATADGSVCYAYSMYSSCAHCSSE